MGVQDDVDAVLEAAGVVLEDEQADREVARQECAGELQAIRDQLADEQPRSRELALALTKLDEAGMWLQQVR